MTEYFNDNGSEWLPFEETLETIYLEPEQSEQAWEITEQVKAEKGKLQIYFQSLALVAFEEWLEKREPNLSIDRRRCSIFHNKIPQVINAVCNLQVGQFKVCLIPTISFSDEQVTVPKAAIAVPEFAAHFYVVIGVEDELDIAAIRGVARYDELVRLTSNIPVQSDDNYELPLANFHQTPDELLLELQCLSPTHIPLPEVLANRSDYLKDLLQIFNQQAVNVGLWVQNKIDEVAQELSWQLLPAPSPLRRFRRTPAEDLAEILTAIDVEIPSVAARGYRDLELAGTLLRLYAVTWRLPDAEGNWALLPILGATPGNDPPFGVKLRVTDLTGVLDEQVLPPGSDRDHLFAHIVETEEEKFLVTITSANGKAETSVLFKFCPG